MEIAPGFPIDCLQFQSHCPMRQYTRPEARPMARPSLWTITLRSSYNTFEGGATIMTYLQILMCWNRVAVKEDGRTSCGSVATSFRGNGSGRWHPHVSCLPDTVNIVVLRPVITGTGLHQECFYKIAGLDIKTRLRTSNEKLRACRCCHVP